MDKNLVKKLLIGLSLIAVIIFLEGVFQGRIFRLFFKPRKSEVPVGVSTNDLSLNPTNPGSENTEKDVEVIAENLQIPWDIRFLTDGDMLVSERAGRLLRVGTETRVISEIEGVSAVGEGGLLGIVLDPQFSENSYIYLYLTTSIDGSLVNRIERYKLEGNSLSDKKVTLDGILGARNHDGGRIEFGLDGFLYVTTGDAQNPGIAQNKDSLNGKILRVTKEGEPAPGNPFGNEVYSYGHRNPQGLAWDDSGNLWQTEHGPSGMESGNDEINLIKAGENYGWPDYVGSKSGEGITVPVLESGKDATWAPASLAFYNNSLFFGGLRGEALYQAKIVENNELELIAHFKGEFGRIRTVRLGPDNFLYLTTSNRDGRGEVKEGDDKIIRVNPEIFFK